MKVVCIKNIGYGYRLTIGKTYDVVNIYYKIGYVIIDDKGFCNWYHKERFKPLSEIRNEKIDKLLGI